MLRARRIELSGSSWATAAAGEEQHNGDGGAVTLGVDEPARVAVPAEDFPACGDGDFGGIVSSSEPWDWGPGASEGDARQQDARDRAAVAVARAAWAAERAARAHKRTAEAYEYHAGLVEQIGASLEVACRSREQAQRLRASARRAREIAGPEQAVSGRMGFAR